MAQCVVDLLEVIEVDHYQRHGILVASGRQNTLLQSIQYQGAVGKGCKRVVNGEILQLFVGTGKFFIGFDQFFLIAFGALSGSSQLLEKHGIFDRDTDLAGKHAQQVEILCIETLSADFIGAGNAAQKLPFPDQWHQQNVAGFFFPAIPLGRFQLVKHTLPPGFSMAKHPATNAGFDR